jgi:putative addiction module component (TIGR02574 family)
MIYRTPDFKHSETISNVGAHYMSPIVSDFDFSRLSTEERILLAQELWDSVYQEAQALPLAPQQRAELDHRFAQLESGEVRGISWEQLRESLLPKR